MYGNTKAAKLSIRFEVKDLKLFEDLLKKFQLEYQLREKYLGEDPWESTRSLGSFIIALARHKAKSVREGMKATPKAKTSK